LWGIFRDSHFTVNAGDLGELDTSKPIAWSVSKLISTYNNGNIFGGLYPYVVHFLPNTKSKKKNYHCGIGAITDFIENSVDWFDFLFSVLYRNQVLKLLKVYLLGGLCCCFWVQLL
jgi:hypothetical protein